jgi:hypothetical protein
MPSRHFSSETERADSIVRKLNESEHRGRVWRTKKVLSSIDDGNFIGSALSAAYYEEARWCWISGAYVATILMTQMALEEGLRSHFRFSREKDAHFPKGVTLNSATFYHLIERAKAEGWISPTRAKDFHRLRKMLRNPYVHTRSRTKTTNHNAPFLRETHEWAQLGKIVRPGFETGSVVAEEKEAIQLLVRTFPYLLLK